MLCGTKRTRIGVGTGISATRRLAGVGSSCAGCWDELVLTALTDLLRSTFTMPGSWCSLQNDGRTWPVKLKLGVRIQSFRAHLRLLTSTMVSSLCLAQ